MEKIYVVHIYVMFRNYSELLNPKEKLSTAAEPKDGQKKLADIMKIELLQDKTKEEIEHIWLEYHKNKEVIVATIPVEKLETQMKRSKMYPIFIIPLPRSQGFEFFLLQFAANTVHFTPLICYQVNLVKCTLCSCTIFSRSLIPIKFCFVYRFIKKMHPNA